jgi:hypothetical protein
MYPNVRYADTDLYLVHDLRDIAVQAALEREVQDLVVDETFVEIRDLENVLTHIRPHDTVYVMELSNVPLHLCLLRDLSRPKPIGADILIDSFNRMKEADKTYLDVIEKYGVIRMTLPDRSWDRELQARINCNESIPIS